MQEFRSSCATSISKLIKRELKAVHDRRECEGVSATPGVAPRPLLLAAMSEVEETLKRINSHKGVKGIVICDEAGTPIRTTLNQEETAMYATHLGSFGTKARSAVRDLDPQNDLTFLRIRTKKHEMMVAPEKDFLLIVVQDPNSE